MIDSTAFIHPKAHVEGAGIGARTKVWQFASVIRCAVIGADCKIAAKAGIDGSRIGDRCIISENAFIDPGMKIGNDVFIGPNVALCNDAWPRVGKDGWFDPGVLIRGDVVVTIVEDGASIGANATVLPGIRIGKDAMIAAGAVVERDVPAGHLYKRDGSITPIDKSRPVRRMRVAA